ncbi:endonuclease/exonuclease/phosphatase family protein [Burkholderia multivorans]|uniref:endonuclease/exonuclease/phosphatase family protein n=1 Tax=Burkholderia multivorans TaxID=87883 RepID=UPI001C23B46A|nr:endonuclease/exonuclease/phosphatase family protein [Burkholderia multivorans]MBU9365998.1 endonuclease/exonuclease/phosphatase family protein [Burkholderia multivorans]
MPEQHTPEPLAGHTQPLRVLTVNIHKGFTFFNRRFMLPELREAIRQVGADVVFLQEVTGEHQRHALRQPQWPKTSHYEFLADTIWTAHAYGRNAVYPNGHHGNAVLSRFPIMSFDNHDISVGRHEARGLLHCVIRPAGDDVHLLCVHLGLLESHRREQLRRVCEFVAALPDDAPVVIAGDFNDWRLRADEALRRCGLREIHQGVRARPVRTYPARCPVLRLDRIYVKNVRHCNPVPLSRQPWSRLSDHVPIAAEVSP